MAAIDTIPTKVGEIVRCLITAGEGGTGGKWWSIRSESIGSISADSDVELSTGMDLDRIWYANNGVGQNDGDVALRFNISGGNFVQWLTGDNTITRIDPHADGTSTYPYPFNDNTPGADLSVFVSTADTGRIHRLPFTNTSPSSGGAWCNLNIPETQARLDFSLVAVGTTINLVIGENQDATADLGLRVGDTTPTAYYVGDTQATKIYLGDTEIYTST